MRKRRFETPYSSSKFIQFLFVLLLFCLTAPFAPGQTGKRPVIIIPGVTGSQMVNRETNKPVWFTFNFSRDEADDLRLPMSPNLKQNTDNLVARDIIREVKLPGILKVLPEIGVYGDALEAIKAKGYAEADWENPKAEDVFYVFAYDWRRDNVETAHVLLSRIEALKTKLNRPDLKFDIVAHSMGGLIARYAAMYGKADLPANGRTPALTWAGTRHINRLLLFGTPNQGSFAAFEVLVRGYSVAGRRLPFVLDLGPDDVFSIPSLYQLLPNRASARFYDENLKPMAVDLYNPANWRKYNWGAISDPKFLGKLKDAEKIPGVKPLEWKIKNDDDKILSETTHAQAQQFLAAALRRANQFQQALNISVAKSPIEILAYGSECAPTLNAAVLVRDLKKNEWRTVTTPDKIKTSRGREISKEEVSKTIFANGDGSVTRQSFLPEIASTARRARSAMVQTLFPVKSSFFFCTEHQKLLSSPAIQTSYLGHLAGELDESTKPK
jgi:pimeloyl-ACP methyl ester carboxylesterase